jgi:hypothetical protein
MTSEFKSYSLPEAVPDALLIRKADLGGFTLEAVYGDQRKIGAVSHPNALASLVVAMLMGGKIIEAKQKAEKALVQGKEAIPQPTKLDTVPKPKRLKKVEAKAEPVKRRGRPPLSAEEKQRRADERAKAKLNGKAHEVALAA